MNNSYSSPPCYASEVAPDYFGAVPAMTRGDLLALVWRLLADEHTIASAAAAFVNDHEPDGAVRKQFAVLQRCGLKRCTTLTELLGRLGGGDNQASAGVAGNAPALRQARAQLEWLTCGQRRLVRSIDDALATVEPDFVRRALTEVRDSHLLNIEACEALVETL